MIVMIDGRTGYYTNGNGTYWKYVSWYADKRTKCKNGNIKEIKITEVYEKVTKALVKVN